jgi:cytochrome c556
MPRTSAKCCSRGSRRERASVRSVQRFPLASRAAAGLTLGVCLALAGCSRPDESAPAAATNAVEPVPGASINEIMAMQAEPAADVIWNSVRTVSDATGIHEYRPATDAEWAAVEQAARALIGVSELVRQPGRPLIHPGAKIEEGGTLTADQIQAKIVAERDVFVERAKGLEIAAQRTLAAIQARDADLLLEVGGPLDDACEACHTHFYYPTPAGQ